MLIGSIEFQSNVFLAPMAGVTDRAFREIVSSFGAGMVYSEMVSAKAMHYNDKKTLELLAASPCDTPYAVQLFGHEPDILAEAAVRIDMAQIIDINMGCPTPKITKNGDGGALLNNPALVGRIVDAVVRASSLPVTVKIRAGYDDNCINAVEIARIAQAHGAAAVAVHGRTVAQQYGGRSDWAIIAKVARAVDIPVIGNGDLRTPQQAKDMLEQTGCAAVMIGRACMGNPWILADTEKFLESGELNPPRTIHERIQTAMVHLDLLVQYKGEYVGIREARKHMAWYLKLCPNAVKAKKQIFEAQTREQMVDALMNYLRGLSRL